MTNKLALLLAVLDLIYLPAARLAAQSAGTADDAIEVTIKSGSGKERYPLSHDGFVDRIGLAPGQVVSVKLKFKGGTNGQALTVSSLDGGTVSGADSPSLSGNGTAHFDYEAGPVPGRYRLLVALDGGKEYWFEFYVLDLNNPQNNPPRVRVVE
jgi:hypothetical protein